MVYILIGLSAMVVFFLCICEVKNIEDTKNLSTFAENTCGHVRCVCVSVLCIKITPSCKLKATIAGSGILSIPHRFLGYLLEQFLSMRWSCVVLCSPLLLCCPLAAAVSSWHSVSSWKLLTLKREKETPESVLKKVWDSREGALNPLWQNTLVSLSPFFLIHGCLLTWKTWRWWIWWWLCEKKNAN